MWPSFPQWNTELQEHFSLFQLFLTCFVSNDCVGTGWHLTQPFVMGGQGLWGVRQPCSLTLIFLAAVFHGKHKTWVPTSHQLWNPSGLFQNPTLPCMVSFTASLYRPQIRTFPRWNPGYGYTTILPWKAEVPTIALNTRRQDFDLGVSCLTCRNNTPKGSRCNVTLLIQDAHGLKHSQLY